MVQRPRSALGIEIKILRDKLRSAKGTISELSKENEKLREEVNRCHARLEIDHYFTIGNDLEFPKRVDLSLQQRLSGDALALTDGITCRDIEIYMLKRDLTTSYLKGIRRGLHACTQAWKYASASCMILNSSKLMDALDVAIKEREDFDDEYDYSKE